MSAELYRLDEPRVRVLPSTNHTSCFVSLAILAVELEAMAVTLTDEVRAIGGSNLRSWAQYAVVASEAHRASEVGDALLLFHKVDDLVRGGGVNLRGVGIAPAQDVAGELDDHALHTEADTQCGDAVLTGIAQGDELPIDTAGAEARSYDDTIDIPQQFGYILLRDLLAVYGDEAELAAAVGSRLQERFVDGLVGILQLDVLTDEGDGDDLLSFFAQGEELLPLLQLRLSLGRDAALLEHDLIEMLLAECQGYLIDGGDVDALHDGLC